MFILFLYLAILAITLRRAPKHVKDVIKRGTWTEKMRLVPFLPLVLLSLWAYTYLFPVPEQSGDYQ
ncbi:MAG: hypothetical protein COY40_04485 [Alphaproteobacteria bacterium CG_4_10_14_0_8_um_filter_53_9]|nr:MAG: hypothetical protein COY40_04485 [Alphaproteobacteria bacterium CG_4_10_14_0_8_um_filter_53_9]